MHRRILSAFFSTCLLFLNLLPSPAHAESAVVPEALPEAFGYSHKILLRDTWHSAYQADEPIHMSDADAYTSLEGITTFRGNNWRDTASWGTIPENPTSLNIVWQVRVGGIDSWAGVGWTGQPAVIRWPEETLLLMNLNPEKQAKSGLTEVIYAALDGKIRFLDLEDGSETRPPIQQPAPIKGSVTIDPRGLPLLYCGQGLSTAGKKSVKTGLRIYSLVDQSLLYFLNGKDSFALRRWFAFDAAPLVDAATDTLIETGENGLIYRIQLNTSLDESGHPTVHPEVVRYRYKSSVTDKQGIENSPAVWDHYLYFADNSGLLSCVDLNTLEALWLADTGDDTDATIVLEEQNGHPFLYTVCELDRRGLKGDAFCRKYDGLTGQLIWEVPIACSRRSENLEAGGFSTPALGKGSLSGMIFFNLARTKADGGTLYALDTETGTILWQTSTDGYSWSSPVCCYNASGRGYLLHGNCKGTLKLYDASTGHELARAELKTNIEGSPVVFEDWIVIGTRGGRIYGIKIQ